jgi:hypothetical protein
MQVITYIKNGKPVQICPLATVTDILDDNGKPTGETVTTDNLQALIAALPDGTAYDLVEEEDVPAWWKANQSADELEAQFSAAVTARLDAFAKTRGWDTLDRVLVQSGAFAADKAVAQPAYDAQWAAAFSLLTQVRDGSLTVDAAVAELPALPEWPE